MKRGKLMLTVLVVLAMLFASCSSHLSEGDAEGGSSAKTVRVSLGVDVEDGAAQKTISSRTDLSGMTFLYCATHNWIQDRPVRGDTNGQFVVIPGFDPEAASSDLGRFTAGEWTFDVRVMIDTNIIYSGSENYTIYDGHATPTVTVSTDSSDPNKTGSISFTVYAPATGGANPTNEELQVYVNGSRDQVTVQRSGYSAGLATYTGSKLQLSPGPYTVTFKYIDEQGTPTDGAAQAVTVFAGQDSKIIGTLDGGTWHSSNIIITAPGIKNFDLAAAGGKTVIPPSTELEYTATAESATGTSQTNPITYEWYVDANKVQEESSDNTYPFAYPTKKMYIITCVAFDRAAKVSQAKSLFVEVGYQVTIDTENIDNGSIAIDTAAMKYATTVFPDEDNVHLLVSPDNGYKLESIRVNGTPISNKLTDYYDVVTNRAGFIMPPRDATVTATFVAINQNP